MRSPTLENVAVFFLPKLISGFESLSSIPWTFASKNETEDRTGSFLSAKIFFLGDVANFEAAEIVGNMKLFVPFEAEAGDWTLVSFKFGSLMFSLFSKSHRELRLSLLVELLLGKSEGLLVSGLNPPVIIEEIGRLIRIGVLDSVKI